MNALPSAVWATQWGHVAIFVFATGDDSAVSLADASAVLSSGERTRAARFRFDPDRERWMRSRALLRLSLADRLRLPAKSLAFHSSPHGKPRLPAHPECHFNLSHSGDFTAVAMAPEPAGIDIEKADETIEATSLAAHAFPPADAAAIASSSAPHLLFYRLWTAREAVMKVTGLGMALPPDSISVEFDKEGIPHQAVRLDNAERFEILTQTLPGEYVLTAARYDGDLQLPPSAMA